MSSASQNYSKKIRMELTVISDSDAFRVNEDSVSEKMSEVIDALSESANWPPVGEIEIRFSASSGEVEETTTVEDLTILSGEIVKEVSETLTELRELMYDSEQGYWDEFSLRVTGSTGEYEVSFGYGVAYDESDQPDTQLEFSGSI